MRKLASNKLTLLCQKESGSQTWERLLVNMRERTRFEYGFVEGYRQAEIAFKKWLKKNKIKTQKIAELKSGKKIIFIP
jgi:hypothetical protein